MATKTFFDSATQKELLERLENLTPNTKPVWGKMTPAQMLTHCTRSFQSPVGDIQVTPSFLRFIGRLMKNSFLGERPFSKNSPTAKEFVVLDPRVFEAEKQQFLAAFKKLAAGEQAVTVFEHGFFGKMNAREWGILMYKHTDHHLQQFGL